MGKTTDVNNDELREELIKSKSRGELTRRCIQLFEQMVHKLQNGLPYNDPEDRKDCFQAAMLDVARYWQNYDPEKSPNPFSYFTSTIINGLAKGWKKVNPEKMKGTISYSDRGGETEGIHSL